MAERRPNVVILFAKSAIANEPTIAANAVAVKTAPADIPSSRLNIEGFTAKM